MENIYPEIIRNLPEADIPFEGVRAWLSQGESQQIVFFDFDGIGEIPMHSHGARWGIVIEGDMDLNINGIKKNYQKGDCYSIPEDILHSAKFNCRTMLMDYVAEKDRYKPKIKAMNAC